MQTDKFKRELLQLFKDFTTNIHARLIVIDQTGQRGQADDIRALTKEIHSKALQKAKNIIENWEDTSFSALCVYFQELCSYIHGMHDIEAKALKTLQALQQTLSSKKISIELIDEAVQAHEKTLQNTETMLAEIVILKEIQAMVPNLVWLGASLHKKPDFSGFLDRDLASKRAELFEQLQDRHGLKAKL